MTKFQKKSTDKSLPKWQIRKNPSNTPPIPLCQDFSGKNQANLILSHLTYPIVGFATHLGSINPGIFAYIN